MKKMINITVTYNYEIEVDTDNAVVKDYENDYELIQDLAVKRFSNVLPVINSGGVVVKDIDLVDVEEFEN